MDNINAIPLTSTDGSDTGSDGSDQTTQVPMDSQVDTPQPELLPLTVATAKDLEEARQLASELVASGKFPEGTGAETIILAETGKMDVHDESSWRYHGWVVVFGVFLSTLMVVGTPSAWGVLQRAFYYEGYFGEATNLQIAFVGSLEPGVQMLVAPVAGRIADHIGPSACGYIGAVLMGGGMIASSFCTQLWQLYITWGLIGGLGAGFSWIPAAATTPKWFIKRRGLAVGIAASGGGFGGLMIGPVAQALLDVLGWQWAMRVIGFIALAAMGLSATLVTLPPGMTLQMLRDLRKGKPFIDRAVLRHPSFLRLFTIGFIIAFVYFLPFHYLPSFAFYSGWSTSQGAMIVAIANAMAGLGRFFIGLGSDHVGIFNCLYWTQLVATLSVFLLWPWSGPYLGLIVFFGIVFGFVSGGFITILPLATAHRFGPQTLATVLGMLNLAWAPGFLFGSPLAGAIIDAHTVKDAQGNVLYQDWWPVQVYGGCLFGACAALALWERLRENKSLLKKC